MKQKIIFRADGSRYIGLGHVIRSLALADMLKEEFECVWAIQQPDEYLTALIIQTVSGIISLEAIDNISPISDEKYIQEAKQFSQKHLHGNEIIVLDGYYFNKSYQQIIRDTGCKLVVIDDLHYENSPAQIIINHNPAALQNHFNNSSGSKLLLGFDYALLRKPFLNAAKNSITKKNNSSVLITMGGADPHELTQSLLQAVIEADCFEIINVLVSPVKKINLKINSSQVKLHSGLNADEMAALMCSTEFIICPASSVCFEAIACGMKIICGYFTDNHKEFYDYLCKNNLIFAAGDFRNLNKNNFNSLLQQSISASALNNAKQKLIDGNQSQRFLKAFKELANE